MRLLKDVKMEVNGSRGRFERKLQRENFREKSTKRRKDKEKGNTTGSVKPGKPHARKYGLSV
ncbi:hypothetical protein [Bacteroides uniformis]|uniref:hypothetical protein n=1 Tax=Bacteroides uniformis TaxID=820 RepID=UPI001FC8EACB|nr:hypothetical protein [Bacteroides uniformis]